MLSFYIIWHVSHWIYTSRNKSSTSSPAIFPWNQTQDYFILFKLNRSDIDKTINTRDYEWTVLEGLELLKQFIIKSIFLLIFNSIRIKSQSLFLISLVFIVWESKDILLNRSSKIHFIREVKRLFLDYFINHTYVWFSLSWSKIIKNL